MPRSAASPLTAYAPTAAKNRMPAYRYGRGMRSSGEQQHGAPLGGGVEVDVLAALGLAPAAAQHVDGQEGGDDEEGDADDGGGGLGADGAALGVAGVHGPRVDQHEHADGQQQRRAEEHQQRRCRERERSAWRGRQTHGSVTASSSRSRLRGAVDDHWGPDVATCSRRGPEVSRL
ncbi:hypothetical protein ACHZ98_05160 [Streptomyces sp. MAR4 CNY-716]